MDTRSFASLEFLFLVLIAFCSTSNFVQSEENDCEAKISTILQKLDLLQSKVVELETQLFSLKTNVKANISLVTKQLRQGLDSSASCYEGKTTSTHINYTVWQSSKPVTTFCDMHTRGGGWIVIQQRRDNSLSFKRGWNEYRNGFGDALENFWIGLDLLHQLTDLDRYELFVEVQFSNETLGFAHYSDFAVGSERKNFALLRLGSFSGTVYDAMRAHEGCNFSTFDRWNVEGYTGGMTWAQTDQGGWWYYGSYESQLNAGIGTTRGMYWQASHLKFTRMVIRKK